MGTQPWINVLNKAEQQFLQQLVNEVSYVEDKDAFISPMLGLADDDLDLIVKRAGIEGKSADELIHAVLHQYASFLRNNGLFVENKRVNLNASSK